MKKPRGLKPGVKLRGSDKTSRIPAADVTGARTGGKPPWIRVRLPASPGVTRIRKLLRENKLATVCEEANCPNLGECFGHGTATFMIMGEICTRRCPFCDVASGRPEALDPEEPRNLAQAVAEMALSYVVITSVDRDDLPDGGAAHFVACIRALREECPDTHIEVLVPDFRGKEATALATLAADPPDLFNHNLETVPRLYREVRPGANYENSLDLLAEYKARKGDAITKSGIMVGLGEELPEVEQVMRDLRAHGVDMITIGQYLQPSRFHLPVARYVTPEEFERLGETARSLGFTGVASAPLVRSSYHADLQAKSRNSSEA